MESAPKFKTYRFEGVEKPLSIGQYRQLCNDLEFLGYRIIPNRTTEKPEIDIFGFQKEDQDKINASCVSRGFAVKISEV